MPPEVNPDRVQGTANHGFEVTFLVPCLNEEENVVGAIETIMSAMRRVGCSYEVLVFDDGSRDNTSGVVAAFQAANPQAPVRLFRNEINRGLAYNFVEGAFQGRGRYYRIVPGDNVELVETIEKIIRARGTADIVVPYFVKIRNRPLRRKIISKLYTWLVNLASGYRLAYYNGNPLYLRAHVMRFHVECTGFGYQAEFLTRLIREGVTYKEIPLIAYDREGSAAISIRNVLSVTHSLITIALRRLQIVLFE
ncbi:MAG TPA: glycosyltransferase family 2 protein [Xanthobacteraceae bacterium]|jgi:dolichol-phosphate mannosyltransferase